MRPFEIRNQLTPMERTHSGENICIYTVNDRDAYCQLEHLAECCAKKAAKLGYLDESRLYESGVLKTITREIRRRFTSEEETFTPGDDRCGRYLLLEHIYNHVQARMEYGW